MAGSTDHDPVPKGDEAEAAHWVFRLDRGLTPEEQDAFFDWLGRDPENAVQLCRQRKSWNRLDQLKRWRPGYENKPNPDLLAPPLRRRIQRWVPLVLAAAACGALAFLGVTRFRPVPDPSPVPPSRPDTTASEQILGDGSLVQLNQGASIREDFRPDERRVHLASGEAYFSVSENASRPFIVEANGIELRAVGTAFNVRLPAHGRSLEVLVAEGVVHVDSAAPGGSGHPAGSPPPGARLTARQRAVVSFGQDEPEAEVALLTPGEVKRVLSWKQRLLDFANVPLQDVVLEFNRRNPEKLEIADPRLGSIPISGSFRSDNVEGFVRLVETGFGAHAERLENGNIRLARRPKE